MTENEPVVAVVAEPRQHGVRGVYYGGEWLDIEDCANKFDPHVNPQSNDCDSCLIPCPRSRTRHTSAKHYVPSMNGQISYEMYDIVIVGAGCIGATIARTLSQYKDLSILWVEAADDVSQGATKGNSGIVHAGYDDTPGSVRAQHCWKGNQMFAQLDRELHFGYQTNGSLVLATNEVEVQELYHLYDRGQQNGVQHLQVITDVNQLRQMEPYLASNVIAALYAPDAGNVIPYEFAIALAENAIDNGVELRIRTRVMKIQQQPSSSSSSSSKNATSNTKGKYPFLLQVQYWEPLHYIASTNEQRMCSNVKRGLSLIAFVAFTLCLVRLFAWHSGVVQGRLHYNNNIHTDLHFVGPAIVAIITTLLVIVPNRFTTFKSVTKATPLTSLVEQAGVPVGGNDTTNNNNKSMLTRNGTVQHTTIVPVEDMFVGGSGSSNTWFGRTVQDPILNSITQKFNDTTVDKSAGPHSSVDAPPPLNSRSNHIRCSYIINCAGGASDQIAAMIGDTSFQIKPRLGDYILLNRNQGHLAKHTLFPCPDPVLGKGVLVQTTLWGNLILGPTARDTYKPEARNMSPAAIQEYILSQCKKLVPSFDAKETIHAFCGARAKSDRGDWIIERSSKNPNFINVAGIDSPGLAGAPSIALKVVDLLKEAGLQLSPNPKYNPYRAPIITPKDGMKGLKMGPVGKFDSDGRDLKQMAANVICKCEKVTELEVVRAMRRSLPIDSSQAIRKRTRAGMGHCQGDPINYNCEARVRAIIARENNTPIEQVGGRPWPATSTLSQRWIDDTEKRALDERMNK